MKDPAVRRMYGTLCSSVGIGLNICLFAGKYLAGVLSGSIAIMADAFNNLSDAGSSLITLIGACRIGGDYPDGGGAGKVFGFQDYLPVTGGYEHDVDRDTGGFRVREALYVQL